MLITCPECSLQVSTKALSCPHCGYPMKEKARRTNRRKRLPNGFGQITEIKRRNLRKPYRAMVTVGKTPEGRPIQKLLKPTSYFESYNAAYAALIDYNRNPYDLSKNITVHELFDKWYPIHKTKHPGTNLGSAFSYCKSLFNVPVRELRTRHLKSLLEAPRRLDGENIIEASPGIKAKIKSLFNQMLDYALEYELVDKNYARDFKITEEIKEIEKAQKSHIAFSDDEIDLLWANAGDPWVNIILIGIYSGWRPNELCSLRLADTNITGWTMLGGLKTEAGIDRVVPVHSKIGSLVKYHYERSKAVGSEYLIFPPGKAKDGRLTYHNYYYNFGLVMKRLGLSSDHKLHDTRKTFVTLAKRSGVDEYAIKYLVGHQIRDLTERVYTERDISWLKEEIEKIR